MEYLIALGNGMDPINMSLNGCKTDPVQAQCFYRFLPGCAITACSMLIKLSDFWHDFVGHQF